MSVETKRDSRATSPESEARRKRLLEAALGVFGRYGFRKTSMDEVARAAELSRQGLYLHFATKEELFRATVEYVLESSLAGAHEWLRDGARSLQDRLVGAFDSWVGRYVGLGGANLADLVEALHRLVGPQAADHERQFVDAVTRAIRGSALPAAYKGAGLTPRQLADTLYAAARGLKHCSGTRAAFVEAFTVAVRAMCAPLKPA